MDNLPKTVFPSLLSKILRRLRRENLVSGLQASGVYPLDSHQVLKRLPNVVTLDEVDNALLNESVLQILKENVGIEKKHVQAKRGRKITPRIKIPSLSDDKNDAPGPSKNKKLLTKEILRMKIFGNAGTVQMNGMKIVMTDG